MSAPKPNDRVVQEIDENLRRVFQEKAEEPLPDRFKDLLSQLRAQDADEPSGDDA